MEPKGPARVERRLAATLAAAAGHSRLTEVDEESTLGRFGKLRAGMIDPKITSYKSHIGRGHRPADPRPDSHAIFAPIRGV
jgi:hypothetical protein